MIPLKLTLKNFLSYQDVTLDFQGLHTVCICGANGAGKSSLLEAIAWTVWGQGRTSSDEDVIHASADYVRTDFVFICYQEVYRIIRSRQRNRTNSLDFQIKSSEGFTPLSRKGVKATQESIISTLKLDYETFINSAYLRQGKADEFMLRRPTERKKVLADLLKLDHYENLSIKAKELARQYKGKSEQIKLNIEANKKRLIKEKSIRIQQKIIQENIEVLNILQNKNEKVFQFIKQEDSDRKSWLDKLLWNQERLKNLQQEIFKFRQEKEELSRKIYSYGNLINQGIKVSRKYKKLLFFRNQEENLANQFNTFQEFHKKKQDLEKQLLDEDNKLQLKIHQQKIGLEQLEKEEKELKNFLNNAEDLKSALKTFDFYNQELKRLDKLRCKVSPLFKEKQELTNQTLKIQIDFEARLGQLYISEINYLKELGTILQKRKILCSLNYDIHDLEDEKRHHKQIKDKIQEKKIVQGKLFIDKRNNIKEIDKLQQKIHELNIYHSNCPLCEQKLDRNRRHDVIKKIARQYKNIQKQIYKVQEKVDILEENINLFIFKENFLAEKLQYLNKIQQRFCQIETQLNRSGEITDKLNSVIKEKIRVEKTIKSESFDLTLQNRLKNIEKKLAELNYTEENHILVRNKVDEWRWADIKNSKVNDLIYRQDQISQQKSDLVQQINQLGKQEEKLNNISRLKKRINLVEKRIKTLNYDKSAHEQISNSIRSSQQCIITYEKLQNAKKSYSLLQKYLKFTEDKLRNNYEEQNNIVKIIDRLSGKLSITINYDKEIVKLTTTLKIQRQNLDKLFGKQGRCEQAISEFKILQNEKRELQASYNKTCRQYRIHLELTKAFSKNGIQLLMIENVLPQLEAETNKILTRLTGNELHIQFITQKLGKGITIRKKSTKLIDTLDIVIADTEGTRVYETYSGGEAFRINFSVRLALAKLLAQRAGASLQMLIIDEGFGTQDTEGCERLIGAINSIASDFSCILIVTHMPQFQEAFQHRIEISKTHQGSQINIIN